MNKFHLVILLTIIILNVGFSYKFFASTLYGDSYEGVESEIDKLLSNNYDFQHTNMVFKEIGDILKQQKDIENSYVMTELSVYAYYSNSKFLYTSFQSGIPSDSLQDFIEQKNWSELDLYSSQFLSYPRVKNLNNLTPDYVIYSERQPIDNDLIWYQNYHPTANTSLFANPTHVDFPKNFELIYRHHDTNTFVYKIHDEQ
tara:strand:+ start:10474 stop:11073 length:600 start_codon:yes stop_codon:yes gene_type:complete